LQENIALVLLDKNFQSIENHALYALTDLIKECNYEISIYTI